MVTQEVPALLDSSVIIDRGDGTATLKARDLGAKEQSIQTRAESIPGAAGIMDGLALTGMLFRQTSLTDIPYWGYYSLYQRDIALRRIAVLPGAEPMMGAVSAIIQKVQSTPWFIEGPRRVASAVRDMLHNSDFGAGWEPFVSRILFDYLTQDNGTFVEIIGEGAVTGPLTRALGIAQIDAARCIRSGEPDYPVVYMDINGKQHKIHWSRVWFQSDLPSPAEDKKGVGYCALSRAVASVQALIQWSQYRNEMLDDFPASGILTVNGVNGQSFKEQMARYEAERMAKEQNSYRGLIHLFSPNPQNKIGVELTSFRSTYENFNERALYDLLIDLIAMAFNIDRQEIAPLSTSALGSGAQSTVLNQKSRGKGIGNILSMLERFINRIIPSSVSFRFDFQDDDQDQQQAQIRQMKATTIMGLYTASPAPSTMQTGNVPNEKPTLTTSMPGLVSRAEARYLLAKEGIIPRELLTPEERMNPGWEKFDDLTMKTFRKYGEVVRVTKEGHILRPDTFRSYARATAQGVVS